MKAIPLLMARSKIPWSIGDSKVKLRPEDAKCITFADRMRVVVDNGSYRGIWCHIPNEGKRGVLSQLVIRAMGLIKGAPDYMFMGTWGHGVIEFKDGKNNLEDYQRYFRYWCERDGVNHATVWSAEQAFEVLKKWGALEGNPISHCNVPNTFAEEETINAYQDSQPENYPVQPALL
jgi:hypothetical protein